MECSHKILRNAPPHRSWLSCCPPAVGMYTCATALYTLARQTFGLLQRTLSFLLTLHTASPLQQAKAPKGLGHPSLKCPQLPPSSPVCPSNAPGDGALSFIFYDCIVPFQNKSCKQIQFNSIQTKTHVLFCTFKKLLLKQKPACQKKPQQLVFGGVVINPGFLVIGCDLVLTTILEISKRPVVCQFVQR